jgi:cardiolipin synthase
MNMTLASKITLARVAFIPVFMVFMYLSGGAPGLWMLLALAMFIVASVTDWVDGYIARKNNQITDFGKFLDPVADKATQLAVFICLITRFKLMIIPFVVLAVKELSSLAIRFVVYKRTETVDGAKWHGKTATGIVIATIILHLLWGDIPSSVSFGVICFCTAFMAFSFVLYTADCIKCLKNHGK